MRYTHESSDFFKKDRSLESSDWGAHFFFFCVCELTSYE